MGTASGKVAELQHARHYESNHPSGDGITQLQPSIAFQQHLSGIRLGKLDAHGWSGAAR